jgi:hypothetical protein
MPYSRLKTEPVQSSLISVGEVQKVYYRRKSKITCIMERHMLLQWHKSSQFCGSDQLTCISSEILTSQTYYKAKTRYTVNSSCLPHGQQ